VGRRRRRRRRRRRWWWWCRWSLIIQEYPRELNLLIHRLRV